MFRNIQISGSQLSVHSLGEWKKITALTDSFAVANSYFRCGKLGRLFVLSLRSRHVKRACRLYER